MKALVKPIALYDGELIVKKIASEEYHENSSIMRLRVYDKMINDIEGLSVKEANSNEVILTPLTSFKWRVRGGPYKWDLAGMGDLEVYINDIKMGSGNSDRDSFLQPTITCPNS